MSNFSLFKSDTDFTLQLDSKNLPQRILLSKRHSIVLRIDAGIIYLERISRDIENRALRNALNYYAALNRYTALDWSMNATNAISRRRPHYKRFEGRSLN